MLALPLLATVVRFDFYLAWTVLWQSVLVLAMVWLLRRNALRMREHEADLDAARRAGDWRPMWTTLRIATRQTPSVWRQLVSNHPTAAAPASAGGLTAIATAAIAIAAW